MNGTNWIASSDWVGTLVNPSPKVKALEVPIALHRGCVQSTPSYIYCKNSKEIHETQTLVHTLVDCLESLQLHNYFHILSRKSRNSHTVHITSAIVHIFNALLHTVQRTGQKSQLCQYDKCPCLNIP